MSTENLILKLKAVEADESLNPKDYLTDGSQEDLPKVLTEVLNEADAELITPAGHCNWPAHKELKNAGFRVTPGETDSFGWLTGVIHTRKGMIVYG